MGLIAWSWFVVANSKFLREHPHISSNQWTTLIGVATLFWVFMAGLILVLTVDGQLEKMKFILSYQTLSTRFLLGSAVLGIICSWCGAYLWNQASLRLPVSFAGQLTIFETLFGLIFVYTLAQQMPPKLEFIGIVILLSAVGYSIRSSSHAFSQHAVS